MAVDITPERVEAAAARLHEGGWYFTPRQLYYAVCRDVETTPIRVAPGELSLGALLILVGALTGNRVVLAATGALGLLLLVVGAVTHLSERRPLPDYRVLVTSYDDFVRDHLDGRSFDGMVDADDVDHGAGAALVVLCDRDDTAAMLAANRARIDPEARIATTIPDGATRLIVVHDASPAGCRLVDTARARHPAAVDAGLNPRDVVGRRPQLIEGAPVLIEDGELQGLSPEERSFLADGKRVELATLTPEETVVRIRAAMSSAPLSTGAREH